MKNLFSLLILFILGTSLGLAQTFYVSGNGILTIEPDQQEISRIVDPSISHPTGLWVNTKTETIYWGDSNNGSVMQGNLNGTDANILANYTSMDFLDVTDVWADTANQKIYFSGRAPSYSKIESGVFSINQDGSDFQSITAPYLDWPRAIAPVPDNDIIYIADNDDIFSFSLSQQKKLDKIAWQGDDIDGLDYDPGQQKLYFLADNSVYRMNTDGTAIDTFSTPNYTQGNVLKLDLTNDKVYWTTEAGGLGGEPGRIFQANLDGTEAAIVYEEQNTSFHSIHIDVENEEFYVSTTEKVGPIQIRKMKLQGNQLQQVESIYDALNTGTTSPDNIDIDTQNNVLYWINDGSNSPAANAAGAGFFIQRKGLNSTVPLEFLISYTNEEIHDLSIDESNGRLFYSYGGSTNTGQIIATDLDGQNPDILVNAPTPGAVIQSIHHSEDANALFYTVQQFNPSSADIHRLNLDDETTEKLSNVGNKFVTQLNYSDQNNHLYFMASDEVYSFDISNNNVTKLDKFNHPSSMYVLNDQLYWTNPNGIFAADLDGENSNQIISSTNTNSYFVATSNDPTVSIQNPRNDIPSTIQLDQNYPNPFNPTTTIGFTLPKQSMVSLKLYNLVGREVKTIYEGRKGSGYHSIKFNAKALPSGVYIYLLKAGNVSYTQKMTLIK